jgi:hypothetical protein
MKERVVVVQRVDLPGKIYAALERLALAKDQSIEEYIADVLRQHVREITLQSSKSPRCED